jgi:hypothetical protein
VITEIPQLISCFIYGKSEYTSDHAAGPPRARPAAGHAAHGKPGICVRTFDNTRHKTDGGHLALLVVIARTPSTLTLKITVWQQV